MKRKRNRVKKIKAQVRIMHEFGQLDPSSQRRYIVLMIVQVTGNACSDAIISIGLYLVGMLVHRYLL